MLLVCRSRPKAFFTDTQAYVHIKTCNYVGLCSPRFEEERINRTKAGGRLPLRVNHFEGKTGRQEGARGKLDEVEEVYLACTLPLSDWAHMRQTGRERQRQERADLRHACHTNSSRRKNNQLLWFASLSSSLEQALSRTWSAATQVKEPKKRKL